MYDIRIILFESAMFTESTDVFTFTWLCSTNQKQWKQRKQFTGKNS